MSKLKVLRRIAVAATAISLTSGAGIAAAATGSIETTGPWSDNNIEVRHEDSRYVQNDNNVQVVNDNPQDAVSGDVKVRKNTTGGDAESGEAKNDSMLRASLEVDNSSATEAANDGMGGDHFDFTITETGPESENDIEYETEKEVVVENTNNISIVNSNTQASKTGDVSVYGNTTGGDATSGAAKNISTTDVTLKIKN
jgi:hypothetical protein